MRSRRIDNIDGLRVLATIDISYGEKNIKITRISILINGVLFTRLPSISKVPFPIGDCLPFGERRIYKRDGTNNATIKALVKIGGLKLVIFLRKWLLNQYTLDY